MQTSSNHGGSTLGFSLGGVFPSVPHKDTYIDMLNDYVLGFSCTPCRITTRRVALKGSEGRTGILRVTMWSWHTQPVRFVCVA